LHIWNVSFDEPSCCRYKDRAIGLERQVVGDC
jgi:hypothetical protein